ncbi:transporter [Bifidobacterium choloepi]|uniref:Transporter n=1 Tax=Bifidobacterium choloepi TaxID=2614131 RepID=A0A6I5NG86_9BIFI|nr:transporter [Bifidobacterium choloepi]NEG70314.1 transporter [Bifidobacterium choloepi]
MTERTDGDRQDRLEAATGTHRPFGWVLLTQLVVYAIMIVLGACSNGDQLDPDSLSFSLTTTAVVAMIVIYAFFNPLRDGIPGRIVALVCGFLSMIFATTPILGNAFFHGQQIVDRDGAVAAGYIMPQAWLAGAAILFVVVIVAAFVCQMAREDRSHLIVSLSAAVLDGIASIAVAGWCFLPAMFSNATVVNFYGNSSLHAAWLAGWICIAVVAICLGGVSYTWNRDADPYPGAHCPWLGIGLTPAMFLGGIVAVAALANALC